MDANAHYMKAKARYIKAIKAKAHYVYTHVDPDTDEIVYVGKGTNGRAWAFGSPSVGRRTIRSKEHTEWYHEKEARGLHPGDLVNIVKVFSYSREALAYEKELIGHYDPIFNIQHSSKTIAYNGEA